MALFEAGTQHQLVHRAVKYGILFIGLTILAFIVLDLGLRARLHPVQYELVGWPRWCSISLLSLAEHVAFGAACAAASTCAILMISVYAAEARRDNCRLKIAIITWGCHCIICNDIA